MAVITSTNYWNIVFQELQEAIDENSYIKYLYISKKYDQAIMAVEERIRFFYGKNAIDNKIPLRQAYKKLPPEQLEMFKDLISTYLRNWNEELGYDLGEKPIDHAEKVSGKDTTEFDASEETLNNTDDWIAYLQECQNRDDITYYEALSVPILNEVEKTSNDLGNTLLALTVLTGWGVYDNITKNLSLQKQFTQDQLKKELLKSWASDGVPLSDRLNTNKSKLSASVKSTLVKGFRNEMSVDEVVAEVSRTMNVGAGAAKRLVVTENSYFNSRATYEGLKQAGYTHYRYICTFHPNSCDDCIDMHNSIFPLEAYEVGVTASPMHPHCLCYIVGEVI